MTWLRSWQRNTNVIGDSLILLMCQGVHKALSQVCKSRRWLLLKDIKFRLVSPLPVCRNIINAIARYKRICGMGTWLASVIAVWCGDGEIVGKLLSWVISHLRTGLSDSLFDLRYLFYETCSLLDPGRSCTWIRRVKLMFTPVGHLTFLITLPRSSARFSFKYSSPLLVPLDFKDSVWGLY